MKKGGVMYIGADYYPEHWAKERWPVYAKWMREAHFNVVRVAEFAWVFMEPEEGRFEFEWLDEALATLAKEGISAILGTPTAVMPAWVARKYPETLAMQRDGTRIPWGCRKNNCFTSGAYRLLSERITRAMAEHFAKTPNVIGWQTDNEFGGPTCYCETCRGGFQDWVRAKYKTLDELNRAWGTHFWGHRYGTWGEIQAAADTGAFNPSLCLDWQRFTSWLNVRFQRDQVRILRKLCPKHFITHNFMGFAPEINYFDLAEDLDHVSWDNYPVWGKPGVPYDASAQADLMRCLKTSKSTSTSTKEHGRNFWIMEQTAGPGGWGAFGRNPRPGEIRKIAYQQMAHGADANIWFRWRTCTAGREQYWHGLLGHDGKPLRRYREAAAFAAEAHALWPLLQGTTVKADVAMIYDYDSLWVSRFQGSYDGNSYHDAIRRFYNAFFRAGVNVDMVPATSEFSPQRHRVVVAPQLHVLPDAVAKKLVAYVKGGGVLVTDSRTGVKDETNLCHDRTLPGLLSDALGITIEEYEGLGRDITYGVCSAGSSPYSSPSPLAGRGGVGASAPPSPPLSPPVDGGKKTRPEGRTTNQSAGQFTAHRYADWVTATKAETLASYTDWHMKEFAAATRNRSGKGTGYYVGTVIQEDGFYDALIADVLRAARIRPVVTPPPGVEVSLRQGRGRKLLFLVNHTEAEQIVPVPAGERELISGRTTEANLTLGVYGVAVIQF